MDAIVIDVVVVVVVVVVIDVVVDSSRGRASVNGEKVHDDATNMRVAAVDAFLRRASSTAASSTSTSTSTASSTTRRAACFRAARGTVAAGDGSADRAGAAAERGSARAASAARKHARAADAHAKERKRLIDLDRAPERACVGYCARCATTHALTRTPAAERAARDVLRAITRAGRLDYDAQAESNGMFDVKHVYARDGGKMIGVLVGVERLSGRSRTLKAFSGQLFGTWLVDGWAPPVGALTHDSAIYKAEHSKIKALSEELAEVESREKALREDVRERAAANDADIARAAARVKEKRERRHEMRARAESDKDARDIDIEALEDESRASKRELAELKRARDAALAPTLAALAECQTRARELKLQRKSLSRALQDDIWDSYRLSSLAGDVKPLREVFYPPDDASAPPAGCGDCAAPKLLAFARELDIIPHSIAEFWLGAESPREFRVSRPDVYYGACRDKCHPILGHLLCDCSS